MVMQKDFSQSMAQDPIAKAYREGLQRMRFWERMMWWTTVFNVVAATANVLAMMDVI